ncbi:beta-galactosidase trimerization domain-containing protein, partial [Streptomyces afghaniensis]|uniref:beta-galactosidase trimerization domain-containing protein n=1 Tax=Streptomyces afghaniensis TaxID=66865 RepID=UPI003CC891E6
ARTPARTALLFDWDSWWALEISDGPSRLVKYPDVVHAYYRAAREAGADVDVIPQTADLTPYDVVIAPASTWSRAPRHPPRRRGRTRRHGPDHLPLRPRRRARPRLPHRRPRPLASLTGIRVDEWDARHRSSPRPVPSSEPRP